MRGRLSGVAGGLESPPEPDYDRRLPESYQVRYIYRRLDDVLLLLVDHNVTQHAG